MTPSGPNHDFVRELANRPGNLRLAEYAERTSRRNRFIFWGVAAVVVVLIFA